MDDFKKELDDYFCRFTFGQFVTLILLEIVTLFFVFYLGARYGPDLLGSREGVVQKENLLPKEGPKSIDDIVGTPPVEYTYPEVLTRPQGQEVVPIKPSGITAEEYEEKSRTNQLQKSAEIPSGPAHQEEDLPDRDESEGPKAPFSIQIGSFRSAEEAKTNVLHWKKKGYQAYLGVGEIPEKGIWYRVRIGGFRTRHEADLFLERFQAKEKVSALVVRSKS